MISDEPPVAIYTRTVPTVARNRLDVLAVRVFVAAGVAAHGADLNPRAAVANSIAKWDGSDWSALGEGVDSGIGDLAVFDDGGGPALYAGGDFHTAGGVSANCMAKWDGAAWSEVGGGTSGGVEALRVFDDGSSEALIVGGGFCEVGGVPACGVAKWDGQTWSALAGGLGHGPAYALCPLNDPRGGSLCLGGSLLTAGDNTSARIAVWHCLAGLVLGDANCDGLVDDKDIDPFVLALVDPGAYEERYPDCDIRTADCNYDGAVNAFDIDPFVELLAGG